MTIHYLPPFFFFFSFIENEIFPLTPVCPFSSFLAPIIDRAR